MKIILSAFGDKLVSKPMDVPENATPIFRMVLTQPISAISNSEGKTIAENPSFDTVCEFEWTGMYVDSCRLYVLRDITKN